MQRCQSADHELKNDNADDNLLLITLLWIASFHRSWSAWHSTQDSTPPGVLRYSSAHLGCFDFAAR
jgi:hypothetical protein